jgi:poly-gamma-glutamate capsule biosynthesis protein CapA/YwtB (metallophosphatase superfamily)
MIAIPILPAGQSQPAIRLFLCGDVMLGRGIDQVLPYPCDPQLHEDYVSSALDYVRLAEDANGPIKRPVTPSYVWGAALDELARGRPDARIINLETSITRSEDYEPKGINYRMSPENAPCLAAAAIDCCVLANNHVLDWGRTGLFDTLTTLKRLGIATAGAGGDLDEAAAPAVLPVAGKSRLLIFSYALVNSGTPRDWAATTHGAGVNLLGDLSDETIARVADKIGRARQPRDVIVVSIHWGPNWGYAIADEQRQFAHALIDRAAVSVVHGHSSHHAKAIEVYCDQLILYGCGDFLNDYEGIQGHEDYRDDLALMYFVDIAPATGALSALKIVPLQIKQFRLNRPSASDIDWLQQTLDRESRRFDTSVVMGPGGCLSLRSSDARPIDSNQ